MMPESSHAAQAERLDVLHGYRFGVHTHRRGHLTYAATGVLSISTGTGTWIAPATRAAWTPARQEHHHQAYGRTDMRVLFVPDEVAARLPAHPAVLAVSPLAREGLLALTVARGPERPPEGVRRLLDVVVDELALAPEQPLHLPEPADDRLRALTRLLHADPGMEAGLVELGRQVGASERTLSRLFHDELGMGFRQWRGQLRLHHALTLLAAGRSVTDTATACGWSNPTSFIEAFTAVLGETPGRYRLHLTQD
jgi:AraC-like DNA-binding protein